MKIRIGRPCHVLFHVSNMRNSLEFWRDVLGFDVVSELGSSALFLKSPDSSEYFDIGLLEAGEEAERGQRRDGVYHVGWEVAGATELHELYTLFDGLDRLIGASHHGTHVSVYVLDPDGNELEFLWKLPKSDWPEGGLTVNPRVASSQLANWLKERAIQIK